MARSNSSHSTGDQEAQAVGTAAIVDEAATIDQIGCAEVALDGLLEGKDASRQDATPQDACRRERRLVEAACRGEKSAIESLYRTHYDTIYRYILFRVGSPLAAEDLTSQVFLGMVRGLGRYRDEGRPFVAWLYGIAQRQVAFYLRTRNRTPDAAELDSAAELVSDGVDPHASAEERELRIAVAQALRKVPEGQREVLLLRYVLSLSVAETATIVGRSEGAVKQLQLRGLVTLRNMVGNKIADLA